MGDASTHSSDSVIDYLVEWPSQVRLLVCMCRVYPEIQRPMRKILTSEVFDWLDVLPNLLVSGTNWVKSDQAI